MTRKSCLTIIAALLLTALLLWSAAAVLLPRLLDLDSYRPRILSALEKTLKRPVSYETASFSRQLIPSIVFSGITIKEKAGDTNLLTVDRLSFRLALLPLLHKEVRLQGIVLERPVILLEKDQAGVFNISDLFTGPPSAYDLQINDIRIINGVIRFTDHVSSSEVLTTSLEEVDLQVHGLTRGNTSTFKLRTAIMAQGGRTELSLSGSAGIPAQDVPFKEVKLDITLSGKNLDAGRYWPYYGRFLPFERIQGALDLQGVFKGTLQEFATKGSLSVRGLRLNYPRVFHGLIAPKQVDFSYELALTPRDFSAKSLALKVDGLQLTGSLALKNLHGNDPHLTVRADSSPFRLEEVGSYIPYGVIPKGTADFIEEHIKGGTFKLLEGRLDGRISQILHMEQGANYNALLVRATVDKGVMSFGPQVPAISGIKGGLEFRGKDFILSGMSGSFGRSPFTLEGRIADYPLKTPASYPFTLSMTPAQAEVAWLLRQEKPGQMAFGGPSQLRLSGSGLAGDYKLSGTWDLSRADYQFGRQIHKPAGLANRIAFSATLGTSEARLTELHYGLPPLDVTASALYRYDDPQPLACTIATNRFDVRAILPVIPALNQYHPTGRLQAAVTATGNPAASDSLDWNGAASVTDLSLRPSAKVSALKHINGTLNLTGTVLELTQLSGRLGNSDLTVKGSVKEFSNPAFELAIASPALHLSDLGFRSPGQDPLLKGFATTLSLKAVSLNIASLTGQLNSSSFSVQGTVPDINNPEITLRAHFPFLLVEDLQALSGLKPPGGDADKTGDVPLRLRATAEAGSVRGISFAKLDTELSLLNSRLAVLALSADVLGGTISGSGTVDPGSADVPSYQAQYRLERVDAAQLSKVAGVERAVSGKLTAEGKLTVQGRDQAELKNSAVVTAKVHLQDGLLPNPKEMGEKMAYSVLDANLSFNRGVITVQGLNAGVFGGTVSGSGMLDPGFAGGPLYQAQYRLERVDAVQLSKAAGVKPGITGQLSANGDLTMQGNSPDGLRKTARGSADVELNNGTLALPVAVEKRNVLEIPFKTIQGRLSFEKDLLTVKSAKINVFDGGISGTGTADFTVPNNPGYRASFTSTSIDVALLDQAFGFTSDITGRLALRGDLTARGEGQETLKKTLQGSLVMRMKDGTLNKFSAISKIFSLLNVSQLFKLRLPDMFSSGMPYDVISGNFSLADGIAVTSDLAIDSPSINMRIVGNSDLVKKEIDLTAAVQPLQSIGMIISRIPVIGWILTGDDNRFLITYFKVKGNWGDPTVTSANISELPHSIFNVFKRVFTLPENMITNTGNVFMGN